VLLGKTIALTGCITNAQGNESPVYFRKGCPVNGLETLETRPEWSAWTINVCADCVGTRTYKLNVSRPGNSGTATKDIVVLGPNSILPTASVNSESSSDNPMVGEHRFFIKRDSEQIGNCVALCASEKVILSTDDNYPSESVDWDVDRCNANDSPAFFSIGNVVYDTKTYVAESTWSTVPIGAETREYYQWVRVKIPNCCNDATYVSSVAMHFKVIKASVNTVKHILQN